MRGCKLFWAWMVLAVFSMGFSFTALAADKYEKEVEAEQAAVKLVREVQRGGYDVITGAELKNLIDAGKDILIVDTMPDKHYKKIHVPGAKQFLFPIPEMEQWDAKETGGMTEKDYEYLLGSDKNKTIIIYCGFVKCTRSHNGAMWAKRLGYQNVLRFSGGIFAWQGAGYKTESVK